MQLKSLKISGQDSLSFMQRICSNDLKDLRTPSYAAFCMANASLVSLAYIYKNSDEVIVHCSNPETLKDHLKRFIVIDDVEVELINSESLSNPNFHQENPIELEEFNLGDTFIKIVELYPEKNLLDKYISFTKGCFPGQEPLAKYKNIGLRKREERSQDLLDEALEMFAQSQNPQELDQAIELLRKALKENPRNEDAYESLGVMLAKQEKYQEAIQVMHTLEMINPQNLMAQMNLSIFYMKIGDKETAEEHKAKATVLQFEDALKK
jgi:tetratricopeptide (TPR) repeat protein